MKRSKAHLHFPVSVCLAFVCFVVLLLRLDEGQDEERRRQLEETLRLSAAACYAAEGIYPPTLAYLEEHYGVQIDTGRYAVFYDIFAENLMPEITVVKRQ